MELISGREMYLAFKNLQRSCRKLFKISDFQRLSPLFYHSYFIALLKSIFFHSPLTHRGVLSFKELYFNFSQPNDFSSSVSLHEQANS